MANYRSSQSFHTLTHWQSGRSSASAININNIQIDGLYYNGQIALVPMLITLPGAEYNSAYGYCTQYNIEGYFTPERSIEISSGDTKIAYYMSEEEITCNIEAVEWDETTGIIQLQLHPYFKNYSLPVYEITNTLAGPAVQPTVKLYRIIAAVNQEEYPDWLGSPNDSATAKSGISLPSPVTKREEYDGAVLNVALENWDHLIAELNKGITIEKGEPLFRENWYTVNSLNIMCGGTYQSSKNLLSGAGGRSAYNWPGGICTGYTKKSYFTQSTSETDDYIGCYVDNSGDWMFLPSAGTVGQFRAAHQGVAISPRAKSPTILPNTHIESPSWLYQPLLCSGGSTSTYSGSYAATAWINQTRRHFLFYDILRVSKLDIVENFSFFK